MSQMYKKYNTVKSSDIEAIVTLCQMYNKYTVKSSDIDTKVLAGS